MKCDKLNESVKSLGYIDNFEVKMNINMSSRGDQYFGIYEAHVWGNISSCRKNTVLILMIVIYKNIRKCISSSTIKMQKCKR